MSSTPLHFVYEYTQTDHAFWQEHLEQFVPRQVIDAHVHVCNPAHCLQPVSPEDRKKFWVDEVLEPITAEGLAQATRTCYPGRNVSFLAFGSPSLCWDIDSSNQYISREVKTRGWRGLALLRPEWTQQQLLQRLDLPGIIGVKPYYMMIQGDRGMHDGHLESSIFDYLPHHLLEVLDDRRAWVTLHVPRAGRLGHPDNLKEVKEIRRRYPNVILVIAHLGRCYTLEHAQEALPALADDAGLYFDSSAVMNPAVHELSMKVIGPTRLMYGTDNPVFYMRGRRQYEGRSYINRTSYPFHFNKVREAPEIEAAYTLYIYEDLLAVKRACQSLGLTRGQVEDYFCNNALKLMNNANREGS